MNNKENNNFWIVYADLMAGLLFVFILLLSAIVLKYVFTQHKLLNEQKSLGETKAMVISKDESLKNLQEELEKIKLDLQEEKDKNDFASDYIKELIIELDESKNNADSLNKQIDEKDAHILTLLKTIENTDLNLKDKNEKIQELAKALNSFKDEYKKLKDNKSKLIATLQNKVSKDISINANSGSISLNASILFDVGEFKLKEEAKQNLEKTLKNYFKAILNSPEVLANIDNIVIEGHTDTTGGYLYNLELSQKRALEIMKFINSFYKDKKLEKLLVAVGKSYNEPIYKNGKEDLQASRRIEIKLLFSNEKAIKDFENNINEGKL